MKTLDSIFQLICMSSMGCFDNELVHTASVFLKCGTSSASKCVLAAKGIVYIGTYRSTVHSAVHLIVSSC